MNKELSIKEGRERKEVSQLRSFCGQEGLFSCVHRTIFLNFLRTFFMDSLK